MSKLPKEYCYSGKKLIYCKDFDFKLKVGVLFSGGKDSTFAAYKARKEGHLISCLITMFPKSDESNLLHYHNIGLTTLQAKAMGIPQLIHQANSYDTDTEIIDLEKELQKAKDQFKIKGIVHGGISSNFQKKKFEDLCSKLDLKLISPVWHTDQLNYLKELVKLKFHFMVTSVSAEGLDDSWLGKEITVEDITKLARLSEKHSFNISFEGGEAETFVTGCPIFCGTIKIIKSNKEWDGYRGRFEITEAVLEQQC